MILWNKQKFQLDIKHNKYKNQSYGLEYLALFFNNWLCVINIIYSNKNVFKISTIVNSIFDHIKKNNIVYYEKIKKYHIIIGGNFKNFQTLNEKIEILDENRSLIIVNERLIDDGYTYNNRLITSENFKINNYKKEYLELKSKYKKILKVDFSPLFINLTPEKK